MKDVCARTGLARSAVHHYIREGLLPRPRKTGRNSAVYDEEFVGRALLIKTLQAKTHLPLAAIREMLNGLPDGVAATIDPDQLAGVTRTIADTLRLSSERDVSREELLRGLPVGEKDLEGLARAGLIEPARRRGKTFLSPLDARIVLAFARIRGAGATAERGFVGSPQVFAAYRKHLNALARVEAAEAARLAKSLAGDRDLAEFTRRAAEAADELIAALHRKALVKAMSALTQR
jgi:DNA-binding transcriptional MerR regulator